MKILITGAAGFIGAYLTRALLENGHTVLGIDNFDPFVYPAEFKHARLEALVPTKANYTLLKTNILDADALAEAFATFQPELVIHLAALANPGLSMSERERYFNVNVEGTANLLTTCTAAGVARFIFAGSSSVYNDELVPFQEDSRPLRPRSPYGESKAAAEELITTWQQESPGRHVTILRFFSVYGPWGRPDMAPHLFAHKILHEEILDVTADERKRDFTYIDDTIAGIVAAVTQPFPLEIINLGRGEPTTLQGLIEALAQAAGKPAKTRPRTTPDGEMRVTYADITKARKLLGYEPRVSLREGADRLITWLRSQEQL